MFLHLTRRIRPAPSLRRAEKFWSLVRPIYQRLLDPFHRGVEIQLGGRPVRVPAALLSTNPDWCSYEREAFAVLGIWLDTQPGRLTLLDVGCSFGVVTSFALQVCPRVEVIAFDSDLVSLRALDAVVPAVAHHRVRRIEGLLGVEHSSAQTLETAASNTLRRLPDISSRSAITRSKFMCLGDAGANVVPQYRLDGLLANVQFPGPVMLKCDVEGAELLVLEGATEFLDRVQPTLLLSVHPNALPAFGQTPDDVAAFLTRHSYRRRLLANDHEEHWLAVPTTTPGPGTLVRWGVN